MKFNLIWYNDLNLFQENKLTVTKIEKVVCAKSFKQAVELANKCDIPFQFYLAGIMKISGK